VFRIQVISNPDVRSPIITLGSTSFFHTRVNNLYLVAVTKYVYLSSNGDTLTAVYSLSPHPPCARPLSQDECERGARIRVSLPLHRHCALVFRQG
jgi:hypothetical protein